MANKTVSVGYSLQYTDEDGKVKTPTSVVTTCPYQSQSVGTIDVPALATIATIYDVPFGAVAAAFCIIVDNHTGQDLEVRVNGAADPSYVIPDSGRCVVQAVSDVAATPLVTDMTVKLTAAQGADPGLVTFKVFGDPV